MSEKGIVALHVGAGFHSSSLRNEYKTLMKRACKTGIKKLRENGNSIEVVNEVTQILENSRLTNAGYGSSLSQNGTVECDASIMDGCTLHHGSVGCVSGIRNPIQLSKCIMEAQYVPLPGGLVPPSLLCGDGAYAWAISNGIAVCEPNELISEGAKKIHTESLKYINSLSFKRKSAQNDSSQILKEQRLDTVGVVCVDLNGNVASSVSSGGLVLKQPGRVGHAATYGCGCWAENNCEGTATNVCVSSSGCGEHLVRTIFARTCAKASTITDPIGTHLVKCVENEFLHSKFLNDVQSPMGGAIILKHTEHGTDFFCLHSTNTMAVAYMTTDHNTAQAHISELALDRVGKSINMFCKSFANENSDENAYT